MLTLARERRIWELGEAFGILLEYSKITGEKVFEASAKKIALTLHIDKRRVQRLLEILDEEIGLEKREVKIGAAKGKRYIVDIEVLEDKLKRIGVAPVPVKRRMVPTTAPAVKETRATDDDIDRIIEMIKRLEERVAILEEENKRLERKIKLLEGQLREKERLEKEKAKLMAQVERLQRKLKVLEEKSKEKEEKITVEDYLRLVDERTRLREKVRKLEEEVQTLREEKQKLELKLFTKPEPRVVVKKQVVYRDIDEPGILVTTKDPYELPLSELEIMLKNMFVNQPVEVKTIRPLRTVEEV